MRGLNPLFIKKGVREVDEAVLLLSANSTIGTYLAQSSYT